MKIISTLILFTLLMDNTLKAQVFKTADDSLAYSLGVLIAENLRQQGFADLNPELVAMGLKTSMKGEPSLIPLEECGKNVQASATKKQMMQNAPIKEAGEKFLAENKLRPGVVSLADGLQYEILKTGDGAKPKATDKVLVHYHGTLIDGTKFDSSVDRGEPIAFPLNGVIPGWTEVLQLMPVGSKWRVYIPYQLAYGERGAGALIKPFSTLIFDIELLEIQ